MVGASESSFFHHVPLKRTTWPYTTFSNTPRQARYWINELYHFYKNDNADKPMDFWVRDFQTNQCKYMACDMEVSQYEGTPKSSVYNEFSSVNHPDIGVPPFMENPHMVIGWSSSKNYGLRVIYRTIESSKNKHQQLITTNLQFINVNQHKPLYNNH